MPPQPNMGSADLGLQYVASTVPAKFGVNATSFKQIDGSGLSFQNLLSPEALVQLLTSIHSMNGGGIF